jgi:hypothetical protein
MKSSSAQPGYNLSTLIRHGTLQAQENKHGSKNQAQKQKKGELLRHSKVAQINLDGFENARMKIALPSTSLGRALPCVRSRCLVGR